MVAVSERQGREMSDVAGSSKEMSLPDSLRAWADSNMRNAKYGPGLLRIAADEIDRLRAQLEAAEQHVKILQEQRSAHEPPAVPVVQHVYTREGRAAVAGIPGQDHDCDAMSCSSLEHIIARVPHTVDESTQPPGARPMHWTCGIHGDFDANVAVGCPDCMRESRELLKAALSELREHVPGSRIVEQLECLGLTKRSGHDPDCRLLQGTHEGSCDCGYSGPGESHG